MGPLEWVAVFLIGGTGSVLRFVVDGVVTSRSEVDFPLGTFVINISGSFVLGFLSGLALSGPQELLAGTAAVGSYTTFSTWMLESQRLGEEREYRTMTVNIVASLVLGVGGAALGHFAGRLF
jgi:fluoride exporter